MTLDDASADPAPVPVPLPEPADLSRDLTAVLRGVAGVADVFAPRSPVLLAATARGGAEPAGAAARAMRDVEEVRRGVSGSLSGLLLDAAVVPLLLLLMAAFHWAFAVFAAACAGMVALVRR